MKKIFWIFVAISVFTHLFAMNFPLATLSDESFHTERAIYILEILSIVPLWTYFILALALLFLVYFFYRIYNKGVNLFLVVVSIISIIYYFVVKYFAIQYNLSTFGALDINNFLWLIRYGSVSAVTYAFQLMIFGYREWALRLIPLAFSILSAVYMYKFVSLFKNEKWAFFSSVSLLFMPGFFYYVNIAQLTMGVIFFILASLYYLSKYFQDNDSKNLVYMCLLLVLGFQYKESFIVIYAIIFAYLVYLHVLKVEFCKRTIMKYLFLSLIPTTLWFITQSKFNYRSYTINENLFSYERLFSYFYLLPSEVTYVLFFLFLVSLPFLLYNLFKRRDDITFIFFTWFVVFYLFFTIDAYPSAVYRYGAYLIPTIAFSSFFFLKFECGKKLLKIISYLLVVLLLVSSVSLTYDNWKERYVPMDEVFSYINQNVDENSKILKTMAPNPYKFYIYKYGLTNTFKHDVWVDYDSQNVSNLHEFMDDNNYSFFIFPKPITSYHSYYPNNYSWIHTMDLNLEIKPVLNEVLLYDLIENDSKYFNLIVEGNMGNNSLYLVEIS